MLLKVGCIVNKNINYRSMATLKYIRHRIRTVSNIRKITKSMKMVSASKYQRCEKELKAVTGLEHGLQEFSNSLKIQENLDKNENIKKRLIIAISSDRGLCGGIHSSIIKNVNQLISDKNCTSENTKVVLIGDKMRLGLQSNISKNILMSVSDVSKVNITFNDALKIAEMIEQSKFDFDVAELVYNKFISVIAYNTEIKKIYSHNYLKSLKNIYDFDDLTDESLESICNFNLAASLFYCFRQSAASEQSSRMTSMENSTKNADEMLQKLNLLFNRTRQSIITRELIEIISGAASLEEEN